MLSSRKLRRPRGGGRARSAATSTCSPPTPATPTRPRPAVDRCIERFGGVDILVNNAATNPYMGPTMDIDLPRYDKTWEVNLRGAARVDPAGVEALDAANGRELGHQHRVGRRA